MKITPQQFLDKLAASPRDAAEFDACAPAGMSRRDHVVKTLNLVETTKAVNVASKAKLAAARARIVALEKAKASLGAMKAYQKQTGDHTVSGFLKQTKPAAVAKPKAQAPAPAPTHQKWMNAAPTTAAPRPQAAVIPTGPISREAFNKLTPAARMTYIKAGGKLS